MATANDELLVQREPPLAWVIINRPQARNAMTRAVWQGLAEQLPALGSDPAIRVVIIRGAGDEAFISGADISEFPAIRADAAMTAQYDQVTAAAWLAIAALPQPVIAMINGLCFGGGCSVAVACDLRFAAEHARFAVPAARLGLAYPLEAIARLLQVVGPGAAAEILLSARTLDAGEALGVGLVNQIVARNEIEAWTRDYALRMADNAPLTLAAHKLAIHELLKPAGQQDRAAVRAAMARCFNSADYQEGVAAFLAKRRPRFAGS
ncbi:MAG: enoyl-CoA hydratase/isomerase family protein [Deltaproteobacteria bacterium]|nr:enoyl-CoA hydratase/isomerase family protein [Deltaproteobacteria bacterium]